MERVLWPIEPVEPRIPNFFTSFIFSEWNAPVLILRFEGVPPKGWGILRVRPLFSWECRQDVSLKYSI